eukprot:9219225-Pyramimonas_sp.AAC.1
MQSQRATPLVYKPDEQEKNASLVVYDKDRACVVSIIHWIKSKCNRGGLVGREVLLEDGKLVFSVAAAFPPIEFQTKRCPKG